MGAIGLLSRGPVGIVATSGGAAMEIVYLLARDQVGVSRLIDAGPGHRRQSLPDGLQELQADPATSVIVLAAGPMPPAHVALTLTRVAGSDKPTIACLLGSDPRPIWQAGAIPAARLDEAAMRAAAWVRGWDQALVSASLEDQRERLAGIARECRPRFTPARRLIYGLFSDEVLGYEARLMLSELFERYENACPKPEINACVEPDLLRTKRVCQ